MSLSDPIADFITVLRNGLRAKKETVVTPDSRINRNLARILQEEGYIEKFFGIEEELGKHSTKFRRLKIILKYEDEKRTEPVISHIDRVSRPGRRIYRAKNKLFSARGAYGLLIVSTSKGIGSAEWAKKNGLGGEVMVEVW